MLSAEPLRGVKNNPPQQADMGRNRQPTSLLVWPSPTLLSLKGAPDVHGPVQLHAGRGWTEMCAAASHTSATVPTLDRASDVAHCAQNFGQNAKLTISLSNTRSGRRAIAEDGRRTTKGQVTGNRRQGRRSQGKRGLPKMLLPSHERRRDGRLFREVSCLGRRGNQNKHPARPHPVKATFTFSTFLARLVKGPSHG